MKDFYTKDIKDIYKELNTSSKGLSTSEQKYRLNVYGENKLKEPESKSLIALFFSQFNDLMVLLLLAASILSAVVSFFEHQSFIDSIIILIIVIINATLSFIQEKKAEDAIKELNKLFITKILVIRDSTKIIIDSKDLVPGDIIEFEAGDYIPADCIVIKSDDLEVNESTITGESIPVSKIPGKLMQDTELYKRTNSLFSGCTITKGHGTAVVYATGNSTELGKIADDLTQNQPELTPLQKKINELSKILSIIVVIIIIVMLIVGLLQKNDFFDILMLSISLAVAAIPEGLSSVITIILSIGMTDMAKKNVIIRKIASIETLGTADIICSDKTGTITKNKMSVEYIYENLEEVNGIDKTGKLINCANACINASNENNNYIGDPTEIAILKYLEEKESIKKYKRIKEYPFDSERKLMSVKVVEGSKKIIYTKGSLNSILNNSKYYLINGQIKKLTLKIKKDIIDAEIKAAEKSLRILGFAYSEDNTLVEKDMVFIGLIGMKDPPRKNVKESIKYCLNSGIKTIMITGDSLNTAVAIGKEVGIINDKSEAIEGKDIRNLTGKKLKDAINYYKVYARVSPSDKFKIVSELQKQGHIVAMTGDGVNDAPAIQKANIGVGMGIAGTEVTKKVADCILVDDSFQSIAMGVEEGRRITQNIKKVILYLLAGNIVEVLLVFLSLLLNIKIFSTIQLLWINLLTDSIPAIMLAYEKNQEDDNKCYFNESFFTPFLFGKIFIGAVFKTIAMILLFMYYIKTVGILEASSLIFIFLIAHELLFSISCKNPKKNILTKNIFDNKKLNIGLIIITIIQIIILSSGISKYFISSNIQSINIITTLVLAVIMFIIGELIKPIYAKFLPDFKEK